MWWKGGKAGCGFRSHRVDIVGGRHEAERCAGDGAAGAVRPGAQWCGPARDEGVVGYGSQGIGSRKAHPDIVPRRDGRFGWTTGIESDTIAE